MAKTYADLQANIASLKAQAEKLRMKERDGVIARIKEAVAVYGITAADLGLKVGRAAPSNKTKRRAKVAGAVKYQNGAGGVWGGRGPRPAWLREALAGGKSLSDFAV